MNRLGWLGSVNIGIDCLNISSNQLNIYWKGTDWIGLDWLILVRISLWWLKDRFILSQI